ncbi:MAG: hypothetical protein HY341_01315 [Candidatus Kerfeldbacteria bacterium]|nr:hypothetical protein [Candidatus Kerfeldbacteria bacterium]
MFNTTHVAVGVLISQHTETPLLAFVFGFLSHFLLDFIPHGDENLYGDEKRAQGNYRQALLVSAIDISIVVALLLFLTSTVDLPRLGQITAGIIGSILPDLLDHFLPVFHRAFRWFFVVQFLNWLQRKIHLSNLVQQHARLHRYFHRYLPDFFHFRISAIYGITIQIVLILLFIVTEIQLYAR